MDDVVVERVLRAVEQVPPGRVVSYGDLAALVGIGPRQVGAVMRAYGGNVTWWRVTNAAGDLPAPLRQRARELWAQEGILLRPDGIGCRIADHRADPARLAAAYERAVADLPAPIAPPAPGPPGPSAPDEGAQHAGGRPGPSACRAPSTGACG